MPEDIEVDDIAEAIDDGAATEIIVFGETPADADVLVELDADADGN